ncbi:splicing factor U2AF 26 kDa subunit isoform X7 [Meles meles]|uniref:splicing factor U2AF 26 kDa subunit isoform X7 n=1 Tax=Meles meles TaxID=9662 RepID=UPI001E699BD1|nr:splicing factor U2AF 26 kDa subunit isoform X7 [Meles meles]
MPQRCTHAPSGTPVVILRGGRRPRIRQSSRQFLSACCVSGGSDELHFPMLLSNGNDVKSRQSWRVRVKMAEYLASIFGTEKDKVNCSFYFKIGACRHGDQCSRLHNKPTFSQFRREEDAERAVAELNNRWFNGQAVHAELSPVTDFRESCCRQYEMGECTRGGFCNFMHLRPISLNLRRQLYGRGPRRRSPPRSHTGHRP